MAHLASRHSHRRSGCRTGLGAGGTVQSPGLAEASPHRGAGRAETCALLTSAERSLYAKHSTHPAGAKQADLARSQQQDFEKV